MALLRSASFAVPFALLALACGKPEVHDPAPTTTTNAANAASSPTSATPSAATKAPDFELKDLDGKTVHLHDFAGKTVVLEWFNPGCPFVNKAHTVGSLKGMPERVMATGVVWLAINSAADGKEGSGVDATRKGVDKFSMHYPVLLDPTGATGHAYGATNTPNMFVVAPNGDLVYSGAIDNSPDAEMQSPTGPTLVNYVDDALKAIAAGKAPAVASTKAYGCSVKY